MSSLDPHPSNFPAVRVERIRKSFPGVLALDDVSFDVSRGEIHALMGENGAGKSTLVGILAGLLEPDRGQVLLEGRRISFRNRRDAQRHGVSYIPQDVLAVPALSVGRNMLLGLEGKFTRKEGLTSDERRVVREALDRCGASLDESAPADSAGIPELRLSQVARALIDPGDVMLLDEPTAVLSEADAATFLQRLVRLRDEGKAIIYVTHRLSEVLEVASRITVLRDGRNVGTFPRHRMNKDTIVALMAKPERRVREKIATRPNQGVPADAERVLEVEGLNRPPRLKNLAMVVRAGEIAGVAGVQGSGHGHLLRAIAGLDEYDSGHVRIRGREMSPGSLRDAYAAGSILVPADRRRTAIVPKMSLRGNLALPVRAATGRFGMRMFRSERDVAQRYIKEFAIATPGTEALAEGLSGGNQQKLALARAFESKPDVLLLEEPTQGIDINAKAEILQLIQDLARKQGLGVVVASSEFEELLEVADTIHVMRLGEIVSTMKARETTYADILHAALP